MKWRLVIRNTRSRALTCKLPIFDTADTASLRYNLSSVAQRRNEGSLSAVSPTGKSAGLHTVAATRRILPVTGVRGRT